MGKILLSGSNSNVSLASRPAEYSLMVGFRISDSISYIEASYYFDKSELEIEDKSFKYYNIGISAVEMPQSVVDNAIKEGEASTGNANDSLT